MEVVGLAIADEALDDRHAGLGRTAFGGAIGLRLEPDDPQGQASVDEGLVDVRLALERLRADVGDDQFSTEPVGDHVQHEGERAFEHGCKNTIERIRTR